MSMPHFQLVKWLKMWGEFDEPHADDEWYKGQVCEERVKWRVGEMGRVKDFSTTSPWAAQYVERPYIWYWFAGTLRSPRYSLTPTLPNSLMAVILQSEDKVVARLTMPITDMGDRDEPGDRIRLETQNPLIIRLMCEHFMGRRVRDPLLDLLQDEFPEVAQRLKELEEAK